MALTKSLLNQTRRLLPTVLKSNRCLVSMVQRFSTIRDEVLKFDPSIPVEKAITPPASWYISPEFHAYDKDTVFSKSWIAVGLIHKLQNPGDFITGYLADEPFIVTRTQDGSIKAFYNVCRHHATLLLDPESEGNTIEFVCPYHGWTYNLDGRLTKARRLKGIQDFSAKKFCLKPIQVETWGPLVFVKLEENEGQSVQEWLSPLFERTEKMGFTNGLRFIERREYKLACNWKVFIDNYLDGGYHVPYAHKDLASLLDENSYQIEVFDGYSIQSSKGSTEVKEGVERVGGEVLYAHIFPNVVYNRYGPWLDVNYCYPVDADNCTVVFDWLLDEKFCQEKEASGELADYIQKDLAASEQVQDEDIWLCERVQKGLKSRSYEWGRYAPKVEHADYDFHLHLAKMYRENI